MLMEATWHGQLAAKEEFDLCNLLPCPLEPDVEQTLKVSLAPSRHNVTLVRRLMWCTHIACCLLANRAKIVLRLLQDYANVEATLPDGSKLFYCLAQVYAGDASEDSPSKGPVRAAIRSASPSAAPSESPLAAALHLTALLALRPTLPQSWAPAATAASAGGTSPPLPFFCFSPAHLGAVLHADARLSADDCLTAAISYVPGTRFALCSEGRVEAVLVSMHCTPASLFQM